MVDHYNNFFHLFENETEGVDYIIECNYGVSKVGIIAPHGGGIEPGTTEIAKEIAGDNLYYYSFTGIKPSKNSLLHIKSTNYNEPILKNVLNEMMTNITIHGSKYKEPFVYISGRYANLKNSIITKFNEKNIPCKYSDVKYKKLEGINENNITNINRLNKGVQLEFSKGIRSLMFDNYKEKEGRIIKTPMFWTIIYAIRESLYPYIKESLLS